MTEENKEEPKLPSFFDMAKNFAKDLKKYVENGAPNVTKSRYIQRLAACEACPYLLKEKMRCGKCGCLIEHKAKWRTTDCPDKPSRWPLEIMVTDYEQKTNPNTKTSNKTSSSDKKS